MTAAITADKTPRQLLEAYDRFMTGCAVSEDERGLANSVAVAAMFGAAAFSRAFDGDQGVHAMARAFLIALTDPSCPDLDQLRADPHARRKMT